MYEILRKVAIMNRNKFKKYILAITAIVAGFIGFALFQNFTSDYDLAQPGSENSITIAKGQIVGSCMYQYDQSFQPTTLPSAEPAIGVQWPMVSCDAAGNTSCAAGFESISETPVQMNCSTSPSSNLLNCYWKEFRCASISGSLKAIDYVRGQEYGNVLVSLDANFQTTSVNDLKWPITGYSNGAATCASGFEPVDSTPQQMNCSSSPTKVNTQNCYWITTRCVKL
jgi:hypothetical protein